MNVITHESDHGWTREIHIEDQRTPMELKNALERDIMVLFAAAMSDEQLCLSAVASVNGVRYDFHLRFVAALKSSNRYVLRVSANWPPGQLAHEEYFRKSSDGWFQLWTRDFTSVPGSSPKNNLAQQYQELCRRVLTADDNLSSVAAVQQEIIARMKLGGTFGSSHKEGGTNICWRDGVFSRSDYGDNPAVKTYKDEAEFLQMLWHFFQFDVTRAAGEKKPSELDAWRLILHRMSHTSAKGATSGSLGAMSASKGIVASLLLLLVGGAMTAWKLVAIESTGVPLGLAARTSSHVLQLITTTESYLPSLHRAPGKDRYRIDLLAISIADPSKQEVFTLIRQQQANALTPMTKILGSDGDVVWVQALSVFAVNMRTKKVSREDDLSRANPALALFLASAKPHFADHFLAVSPDWTRAFAFSPETLKATACAPPPRAGWLEEQAHGRIEGSLCSGGLVGEKQWLAVAPKDSATREFKPGSFLSRDFAANEKDTTTVLLSGEAEISAERSRIRVANAIPGAHYRQANFIRRAPGGPILQAEARGNLFLLHRQGPELFSPQVLTQLTIEGASSWTSPTPIGRLTQILPGSDVIALIGERTPLPDKVPEPILVLIDAATGVTKTTSLWRKP
ncbi:MAG: hypothetical protein JNJ83_10360 [Verrucomicrobiaceae bacterium]|nr:hypothetical protein [Verrucomicrobiaceae bacterium]